MNNPGNSNRSNRPARSLMEIIRELFLRLGAFLDQGLRRIHRKEPAQAGTTLPVDRRTSHRKQKLRRSIPPPPRSRKKKGLQAHLWRIPFFFEQVMLAERTWGQLRLLGVLGVTVLLAYISWRVAGASYDPISLRGLRHLVFPVAAVLGAFLVAGHYVQDIHELTRTRKALRYLFSTVFGLFYPVLRIENGTIPKDDEENLVLTVGGPGILQIQPGNAVLCERLTEPADVFGAGHHFINHLETVKEAVSLLDQQGRIEATSATTKDGIEVVVRDVNYRYRVRTGRRYGDYYRRTSSDPYPFSAQAVRNRVYNRSVSPEGLAPWANQVRQAVAGAITEYIQNNPFDKLTKPGTTDTDPRQTIHERLEAGSFRNRIKGTGAELLWCGLGHFDLPEKVDQQMVDYWSVRWKGRAKIELAIGEGERMALEAAARAQAQAYLLCSIMDALKNINLDGLPVENYRRLILMHTAQILDTLVEPPQLEAPSQPPPAENSEKES